MIRNKINENKTTKIFISLLIPVLMSYASPSWAEAFKSGQDLVTLMEYYEKAQNNSKEVNWRAFEFRAYVVGAFDAMSWQYEIPKNINVQQICDIVVVARPVPWTQDKSHAAALS